MFRNRRSAHQVRGLETGNQIARAAARDIIHGIHQLAEVARRRHEQVDAAWREREGIY